MPVDLDKIRALLASVAGFTPGPWRRDGFDVVPARLPSEGWQIADCGTANSPDSAPYNTDLIAAAPDLHRELTEAVGEIERLRAHNARMADLLNKVADAMDEAEHEAWDDGAEIVTNALPVAADLRRLAAGEVDDG